MESISCEDVNCVLCGGNRQELTLSTKYYLVPMQPSEFSIVKCLVCGLKYINPQPIESEICRYYPKDYGPHQTGTSMNWRARVKFWLESRTLEIKLGYPNLKMHSVYIKWLHSLAVNFFPYYYPFVPYVKQGRLLDVGAGVGRLLSKMKDYGWETFGVEPGEKAASYARTVRKLNVFTGTLIDAKFENNFFDGICYLHVLEHLHDPVAELREVWRILKPGGYLYLQVPNIDSIESKVFGKYWDSLQIPVHLYHFSPETIDRLLRKVGFTPLCLRSYSSESPFFHSVMKYMQQELNVRSSRKLIRLSEFCMYAATPLLWLLYLINRGCFLKILVQKTSI